MKNQPRLLGIDLCRGIAAYAVILVHSGDETWGIPVDRSAVEFRHLFYFSVPFFLATSFYLTTRKSTIDISWNFWLSRIERILIPYVFWSLFYLLFKFITFSLTSQTEAINNLIQDPLAIIFFGGASYHLYFLPLLFSGYFLLPLGIYLREKKISTRKLIILSCLSTLIAHLILISNNSFILSSNLAFPGLLDLLPARGIIYSIARLILVALAWLLRCLPYLLTAMIVNILITKKVNLKFSKISKITLIFLIFILFNISSKYFPFTAITEIVIAYSLLLFAIALSSRLKQNKLIINLGLCSFGIYLIHPIIKSCVEIIIAKGLPQLTERVSIESMLVYSTLSFALSWWIVSQLIRHKLIAKYMFGI
ncbi:MAG: acyltransferase [Xenococcaceae cyanobacterium]